MKKKRLLKRTVLITVTLLVAYGIYYCWLSFPIANGYSAKVLCSGVFVSGRKAADIKAADLNFFPVNLGRYEVNDRDSSVTYSLLGLAKRKAIYRHGLGATLVSERTERDIRHQHFRLALPPAVAADSFPWPLGDKPQDSFPASVDKAKLDKAVNRLFIETDSNHLIQTRAVVVVYNGQLVAERYAPGFTKDTRLIGWSMTKSITNALIGLLVKNHQLDIHQPAPVPEWGHQNDPRYAITLKDLLQQSSGLEFVEDYAKSSDATKMLFQRADMGAYVASHSLQSKPGSFFYYSSGNTNILSRIIRQTVGDSAYYAFPYEQLFYKLGMYHTLLEVDASGTFVGSSYSYATARDWARFGLLYLNDGVYNSERLLPEGWVQQTTTPAPATPRGEYGFQFWLNAGEKGHPANRLYPHVPADLFCADGFEGQNVFVIPSKKLVVVRLGLTRDGDYGADAFLANVINAIR